jgi:hypothetical protein
MTLCPQNLQKRLSVLPAFSAVGTMGAFLPGGGAEVSFPSGVKANSIFVATLNRRDHEENLGTYRRIILKWSSKKYGKTWIESSNGRL